MLNLKKIIKPISLFLFSIFSVFCVTEGNGTGVSSFEDILPAGTRMVIPTEIMQEYQFVSKKWGHPFNYLSHYYSSLGPSTLHKDQHTYYIPLSREDKQNTEQPISKKAVMVDLMNVKMNEEGTVFTAVRDSYIIQWKNVFIAIVDIPAWNQAVHPSLLTTDK